MIKVGIIGMGRMGQAHAKFFTSDTEAKLVAFYDPKPEAVKIGVEQFKAKAMASGDELIASPEVEAIVIASPTYCHYVDVIKALKTNKPVFCEKPLCRSWDEADAIRQAAENSKSVFQVGFVRRFNPAQQGVTQLVQSGAIGRPLFCNINLFTGAFKRMPGDWFANYTLCGGVVLDMLSHHLDLINWCFGDVARVYAQGFLEDPRLPEPTDFSSATVTFKNGVICNLACGWNRVGRGCNDMEIFGTDGYISYSWAQNKVIFTKKGEESKEIEYPAVDNPYFEGFRSWIKSIKANGDTFVNMNDAFNALDTALAILKSSEENAIIEF